MHENMDKNTLLIQLSERGRFWRVDFDDLSRAEQVFRVIWELEAEVNNGGFHQYFSNSSGDSAFAVVDALKGVGAHHAARIAADANGVISTFCTSSRPNPEAVPSRFAGPGTEGSSREPR